MQMIHHATLVRANSVSSLVLPYTTQETEIYENHIPRFGIDDARALVKRAYQRPVEKREQVLVVRTDFISLEAQNALLKLLEEPPLSTKLVFVVPYEFSVLPTLISRFSEESIAGQENITNDAFEIFINQSYKDRLAAIDQATKKKDVEWQQSIKRGLINLVAKGEVSQSGLSECEYVARNLLTRGASNKMLLEQAALTLATRSK